jgi:hypothetical protein
MDVWVGATGLRDSKQPIGTDWWRSNTNSASAGSDALFVSSLEGWSNADGSSADTSVLAAHFVPDDDDVADNDAGRSCLFSQALNTTTKSEKQAATSY